MHIYIHTPTFKKTYTDVYVHMHTYIHTHTYIQTTYALHKQFLDMQVRTAPNTCVHILASLPLLLSPYAKTKHSTHEAANT